MSCLPWVRRGQPLCAGVRLPAGHVPTLGSHRRLPSLPLRPTDFSPPPLPPEAIFGEELEPAGEGVAGFRMRVVPHPGQAEANHVAVVLSVRCAACRCCSPLLRAILPARRCSPPRPSARLQLQPAAPPPSRPSLPRGYPREPPGLRLTSAAGLAEADVRALSKALHGLAAEHAGRAEICCFQLVTAAQDYLRERNVPPEEEEAEAPGPESLWHEMQLREAEAEAEAGAGEASMRAGPLAFLGTAFADAVDAFGLFGDAAEPAWASPPPAPAAAASPAKRATSPAVLPRPGSAGGRPPKPPSLLTAEGPPAVAPRAAAVAADAPPPPPPPLQQQSQRQPPSPSGRASPFAASSSEAEEPPAAGARPAERSAGGVLTAMRRAASAMLPKPLRRYLDSETRGPCRAAAPPPPSPPDRRLLPARLPPTRLCACAPPTSPAPTRRLPSVPRPTPHRRLPPPAAAVQPRRRRATAPARRASRRWACWTARLTGIRSGASC